MNKAESIRDRIELKTEGKSSAVLFADGLKVIGLGFMSGQKLAKHSTPAAAFLLVTEGSIEFTMGSIKMTIKAGEFVAIPAKEEHEILATENSRILLAKGV